MADNPYQDQTTENTSTVWLDDQKPVDLDLAGMAEYAKNMMTIQTNLTSHLGHLSQITELAPRAWEGSVLAEGEYARTLTAQNHAELMQYCAYLGVALMNIGSAAQTVADIFSSTDGWSAASLDAVRFAFGDQSVPKPAGLPPWVTGKTWWDSYFENLGKGEEVPGSPSMPVSRTTHHNPDGSTTYTSVDQNGITTSMTVYNIPGGYGTQTTTIRTKPDGTVLSEQHEYQSARYDPDTNSVVTTRTNYDPNGAVIGRSTETVHYGSNGDTLSTTTSSYDANGTLKSTTFDGTRGDGTQEIQVVNYDADGNATVVEDVHAGAPTQGQLGVGDSPAADAAQDIQHMY